MSKSLRKNVPDMGLELGAACMPSEHASDRATAPGYKYFVPFAVVCNLKISFCSVESYSTQVYDNFLRNVIVDVRRHLKQRYATATCEGLRADIK